MANQALAYFEELKAGLPFLQIETDYSTGDLQQLKVRIDAFLEMIK